MLLVVTRLGPVAQALVALQHFLSPSPLLKRASILSLYICVSCIIAAKQMLRESECGN